MSSFREVSQEECTFCKGFPDELSIKSNADTSRVIGIIANGLNGKELVLVVKGTAYGIEIDYCPMCGRKLNT